MGKWYGSINNRVDENKMFVPTIEVGTGVTEYHWSDRDAYEVTKVIDQKHVYIRELKHTKKDGAEWYSNSWVLSSDETKPEIYLVKRGKYWYAEVTVTPEEAQAAIDNNDMDFAIWAAHNDIDLRTAATAQRTTKRYHKRNVSFGVADYYYDYEF